MNRRLKSQHKPININVKRALRKEYRHGYQCGFYDAELLLNERFRSMKLIDKLRYLFTGSYWIGESIK